MKALKVKNQSPASKVDYILDAAEDLLCLYMPVEGYYIIFSVNK